MDKRLAWDGRYYTNDDFLRWYGLARGHMFFDNASVSNPCVSSDLSGGCTCSWKPVEHREAQDVEEIVIAFILVFATTACKDLVLARDHGTTVRSLRDYFRRNSSQDEVRILDWDSALLVDDKVLDLRCTDLFVVD